MSFAVKCIPDKEMGPLFIFNYGILNRLVGEILYCINLYSNKNFERYNEIYSFRVNFVLEF